MTEKRERQTPQGEAMTRLQEYMASVDGAAHASAVRIIEELERSVSHYAQANHKLEYENLELRARNAELRSEVSYAEAKREELEADVAKVIRARNQWEDACESLKADIARHVEIASKESAARIKAENMAFHAGEELEAARALLRRAEEELRLIRMKDCGAVYDTTLRIELHAATKEKPNAR